MTPDEILLAAVRSHPNNTTIRRAFKAGFTIPRIVEVSGWEWQAVWYAVESYA